MRVVKKRFFYGQADHKGGPPGPLPQPYDQLFVIFLGVCLTLDYDYMCSETDFRKKEFFRKKSFLSNDMNPQFFLITACHIAFPAAFDLKPKFNFLIHFEAQIKLPAYHFPQLFSRAYLKIPHFLVLY